MSSSSAATSTPAVAAAPPLTVPDAPSLLRDALALTKPGITRLVVITAGVGFALAAMSRTWRPLDLLVAAGFCALGTALTSSGANALNQVAERVADARMPRTRNRPIPAGRMSPRMGIVLALGASALGLASLVIVVNVASAIAAAATIALYIAVYTPSKKVTIFSTVIGAVPGALPTMLGWAAASQGSGVSAFSDPGAWALFLVLFSWQMPHFLAIAWMHRDGYACAGFRVLSVGDRSGRSTAWICFIWTFALVASTLVAPVAIGAVSGWIAAPAAIALGALMLRSAWRFVRERSRERARSLFLLSITHLPLFMVALVVDAVATRVFFTGS